VLAERGADLAAQPIRQDRWVELDRELPIPIQRGVGRVDHRGTGLAYPAARRLHPGDLRPGRGQRSEPEPVIVRQRRHHGGSIWRDLKPIRSGERRCLQHLLGAGSLTPCTAGSFTTPPPAATASLSANPNSLTAGQSSTLSWNSTKNASSCTGGGFTMSGSSGSAVVSPIVTTSYSITCTGDGGSATALTTVTVGSSTTSPSSNSHGHGGPHKQSKG
jgi:hypothetical protein